MPDVFLLKGNAVKFLILNYVSILGNVEPTQGEQACLVFSRRNNRLGGTFGMRLKINLGKIEIWK